MRFLLIWQTFARIGKNKTPRSVASSSGLSVHHAFRINLSIYSLLLTPNVLSILTASSLTLMVIARVLPVAGLPLPLRYPPRLLFVVFITLFLFLPFVPPFPYLHQSTHRDRKPRPKLWHHPTTGICHDTLPNAYRQPLRILSQCVSLLPPLH